VADKGRVISRKVGPISKGPPIRNSRLTSRNHR